MSDPKLPLYSNFCKCPACGEYFNSEKPFAMHRTGPYTDRKCLNPEAMEAKGMVLSKKGYWLSEKHVLSHHYPPRTDDL